MTVQRMDEERKLHCDEISQLKEMLKREVTKADADNKRNEKIISDYKQICQRLDLEQGHLKTELASLKKQMRDCEKCCQILSGADGKVDEGLLGVSGALLEAAGDGACKDGKGGDEMVSETNRIRELELELAQTKLAQVEAECRNQVSFFY